jgi:hypothetical protein
VSFLTLATLGAGRNPFPASYDGSSKLFAFVLFAMIVASCLAITLGSFQIRQLWADRRYGRDPSWAINSLVLAVCCGLLMRCLPEAIYMVSYAEASPFTLSTILTIKRVLDFFFLAPVLYWMATFWMWRTDINLKLRSAANMIYTDYRLASLNRFASVVGLSAALAICVTVSRVIH